MKYLIALFCITTAVFAQEKYIDKYDNMNVDEILSNKRLLKAYFECIMDKGPCTVEGAELKGKAHIQDAIETGCSKCTEVQQKNASKIFKYIIENEREMWNEATAKFDPTVKWRKKYEERAKAEGIVILE